MGAAASSIAVGGRLCGSAGDIAAPVSTVPRRIFGLGMPEILVIMTVGAVVLGPETLKGVAMEAGKAAKDLKEVPDAFQKGMEAASDKPVEQSTKSESREGASV